MHHLHSYVSPAGIEPHLLAILRYAQEEADNFLLIPGDAQSTLALFHIGALIAVGRHPGIQTLTQPPERLTDRINEFAVSLNIAKPILTLYSGEVAALKARELADKLPLEKTFIEPPRNMGNEIETEEGRLPLDAFVLSHSRCYPGGAFVSEDHLEKSLHFTSRHYRGDLLVAFNNSPKSDQQWLKTWDAVADWPGFKISALCPKSPVSNTDQIQSAKQNRVGSIKI